MDRSFTAADAYNRLADRYGWACYCDSSLSFDRAELADMLVVWRGAHDSSGGIPRRAALTARLLKPHMPAIAIYERVTSLPLRYRVRLMGTRFAEIFGDLSGKMIDERVPPSRIARFQAAPEHVLLAGAPLRFIANADIVDKQFFVAEYLMVPLVGDDGEPDMVLSRAHFSGGSSWPAYLKAAKSRLPQAA